MLISDIIEEEIVEGPSAREASNRHYPENYLERMESFDLSKVNDPAIKLFGKNIMHPNEDLDPPPQDASSEETRTEEDPSALADSENEGTTPTSKNPETVFSEQHNAEPGDKDSDANTTAAFKKPDKIVPCPRCNSMETKFCYFNNYNVNQPRHFCRSCQRYWTAGGAIRNVPVGAGRRKHKHSSSQVQPVVIPATGVAGDLKVNPDSPLYKSVANKLSLLEPEKFPEPSGVDSGTRAGFPLPSCSSMRENEIPYVEKAGPSDGDSAPLHTVQSIPGPAPYPWNFGWNGMAYGGANGTTFLVPYSPGMAMSPGFCVPNVTIPMVSPMCWGWDPNAGNLSPSGSASSASCSGNSGSGNTSPLGKHLRDPNPQDEVKGKKNLWIPKTLRIDDPVEAAKSSIWSTLGIKPGKSEPISKGGMFKAFHSQTEGSAETSEAKKALQANPAALSRSNTFQESA